jgi:hypothetical protein
MHLITESVHVFSYNNSAIKSNKGMNKTIHHDTVAQTITEPHVSLLGPGILDCRLPWVFSKHKLFLT